MSVPGDSALFRPGGPPWTAVPDGVFGLPRSCQLAAIEVILAIVRRSGRMERIMRARSGRERDRLVMALFTGPDPIEVDCSDRELAERTGRSASFVQKGLHTLERYAYCERIGRGPRRRIRLRLPAPAAPGGPP